MARPKPHPEVPRGSLQGQAHPDTNGWFIPHSDIHLHREGRHVAGPELVAGDPCQRWGSLSRRTAPMPRLQGPCWGQLGTSPEVLLSAQFTWRTTFGKLTTVLLGGRLGARVTQTLSWRPVSSGWQSPVTSLLRMVLSWTESSSHCSLGPAILHSWGPQSSLQLGPCGGDHSAWPLLLARGRVFSYRPAS